jgi:uncharacterized surface protein with fasciclin (FAS1) repeats
MMRAKTEETSMFRSATAFAVVATMGVASAHASEMDIVDTAINAGDFETLVAAVQAADLVDTLKGDGPFTVFAPTDEAFAKLPEGTVETLLMPENKDQLVAVLTYHVLPGAVMSGDIAGQKLSPETVQGSTVDIDATDGVTIDGAQVIAADIGATMGVIHVIYTVILPK